VSELIRVKFGLESSFKYWSDNFKCFFDTIDVFFWLKSSLKWLLRKSFEHSNKIKQVGRVDNVGHVGNTHSDRVRSGWGYVKRLHVGLINGDSIDYNDKSGDDVPFIILKIVRLFLLISSKCLRKLYLSIHCLGYLVYLGLSCLSRLSCLSSSSCCRFGVRAIVVENGNKMCELVRVGGSIMRVLGNQQPTLQKQSAFKSARLFLLGIWQGKMIGVGARGIITKNFIHLGKCSINFMSVNASILPSSTYKSITSFVSKSSIILKLNILCQFTTV
jgi:hypothetical protein